MTGYKSQVIRKSQEISLERIIVDHRSLYTKLWDGLQAPSIPLIFACVMAPVLIFFPAWFFATSIVFYILQIAVNVKDDVLPIHLPLGAGKVDKHDPLPGQEKAWYLARGSFYIGYCRVTAMEIWANFKALTQHFLIFGTTGAGKTESIVSYIINYLSVGSAVAFQDAKAAPKAMFQIATFCRIFARDFDFRVTNYITSLNPEHVDPASRSSNDAGIFARGTPDSNTQLLVSLMPPSGGDNKIFAERAIALVASIMPGLNDLRNLGKLQIDPSIIRKFMGFKDFVGLCHSNFISKSSRDALVGYLSSLSGYNENLDIDKQNEEVTRQFGFAQAYFTRALASLSDTYGHIYLTGQGEIDYQDAVLNGRIVMTLLPSMSKSGDELANLGKIVLTATRNGMVVGLGTVFEGSAERVVHNLPTNSDVPYGIMNDENAYMLVEGQEMMNAQARGLGFGVLTGTQDVSGMLLSIEKTTKQIMANSGFKQFMYLDDEDTTKLACELSGEASVIVRGNYKHEGSMSQVYADERVNVEKRYRLNATALKKLKLGQAYITYQGDIHETQVFNHGISEKNADPKMCYLKHWWPVRMAKVHIPSQEELAQLLKIDPRGDWLELAEMISDDSRALLREMKIYFGSMIAIRDIQKRVAENPTLRSFANSSMQNEINVGSFDILGDIDSHPDRMTGVLASISTAAISSPKDVFKLFKKIADDREGPARSIRSAANQSGIDDFLSSTSGVVFNSVFDEAEDTGTAGGAGAGGMKPSLPESTQTLLDDYLSDMPSDLAVPPAYFTEDIPDGLETPESLIEAPEQVVQDFASREDKSSMAQMVVTNLALMPWMANVVDYSANREELIETETFFSGESVEVAAVNVDLGLDLIASKMTYPTTRMDHASPPNLSLIRSLLDKPS